MEHALTPHLRTLPFVLLDGALATELEPMGCDLADPLWSAKVLLEAPEKIRTVHAAYLAAGADVVTTASYQATYEGFAGRGLGADAATGLMQRSVQLAREARDAYWSGLAEADRASRLRPLVAASVGPYGAMLADGSEYRGHYGLDVKTLMDFHRPRLAALLAAGPDLLACETLPSLLEAQALVQLLENEFPDAQAWISFSCTDDRHISEDTALDACVAELSPCPQVLAIGFNCTAPRHAQSLLAAAAAVPDHKPLLLYPNSGEGYDAATKCWHGSRDAAGFAASAKGWLEAGARLIGGCCRTGPAEIAALAAWRTTLAT
ncbi:homocysteine S-methyltransferase [Gulbenkiania mobilis]|uniref:Homocysteine S-methyltransferase n=1 Tax=Gulbenkiania mobilis TaxID=397457 RepID=A0ABY2CUP1_GULMO|nr:homocysteine S-methyltransferase [Gulbenkiania mobilis]